MAALKTPYMEYKSFLEELEKEGDSAKDDVYKKLMSKEQNTLNVIQRVVESRHEDALKAKNLLHMPIVDVLSLFSTTWRAVLHELIAAFNDKNKAPPTVPSLVKIILSNERKIVMGLTLVMICVFLFFVEISN